MATRSYPSLSSRATAMAMLSNRQKPIALSGVAWCPGGRMSANGTRPRSQSLVASTAPPTDSKAIS